MTETILDKAHRAMTDASENDQLRLTYFGQLASAELYLFLEQEISDDQIKPQIFNTEDGDFILAFDSEDRLAEFAGGPAPYAAISGRALAKMLTTPDLGVLLNPGLLSSEALTQDVLRWMRETLSSAPEARSERLSQIGIPDAPELLVKALDQTLASARGLADGAYLAKAIREDTRASLILGILNVTPGAETALTNAVQEAVVFSGGETMVDVVFLSSDTEIIGPLEIYGLRFDIPQPETPRPPSSPGMDPSSPPKLR